MDFEKRYVSLNEAQRQAVDTIDGPVMVVAGPGTGKTELLSVRVANILQKTDTLPENILCLTFTDSGANAMRERLVGILGKDAYKVGIHTFHSFGTEIINQYGDFFYQGAHFRPADELSSYEIIRKIFEELDYDNVIAKKSNDEYTYLTDTLTAISELKKSGLTSDELLAVLDENNVVIEKAEQLLSPVFAHKIDKTTAESVAPYVETIRASGDKTNIPTVVALSEILTDSLTAAVDACRETGKTTPITAWRNQWMVKNQDGNFVLKSRDRQTKLRAVAWVYDQYLLRMQEAELFDFDDMILRVVHAIEIFDDLRFNLQEKYQYIMVDEFQDTNMAQMRILHNLTNNIANEGKPNIMVVGDDDQAIYSFQGADISNILDFRSNYPSAQLVTLTDNYRSINEILQDSRQVILQGNDRLENRIQELNKQLTAKSNHLKGNVKLYKSEMIADERHWLVNDIKSKIKAGVRPSDIAVLTRRHSEMASLLPYFAQMDIAVNYERRDNVLEQTPIKIIEQTAKILIDLSDAKFDEVNTALPKLLAHEAWGISATSLYKLSLGAYKNRTLWLEAMETSPEFRPIHQWMVELSTQINDTPLEQMLDIIIGRTESQIADDDKSDESLTPETSAKNGSFVSPFYNYYFAPDKLEQNPDEYLSYLEGLRTIRAKLRDFRPTVTPTLRTFVEFINLHRKLDSTISSIRRPINNASAINLMTAHKSKGLEFDTVYIINAVDSAWGERVRGRNRLISYPENLPLAPAGDSSDERLRLFYVAMTRAKQNLNISYSLANDNGKATMPAAFLIGENLKPQAVQAISDTDEIIEASEMAWYQPLTYDKSSDMQAVLKPTLENYKLSVTHLHNFLDVTRGGPTMFLLQNLLRFPQALSPHAAYGSAIHFALWRAHSHLAAHGERQAIEDVLNNFETNLHDKRLDARDHEEFSRKGADALRTFLDQKYDTFRSTQKAELNFAGQQSMIDDAHLTGSLDLVDIDDDKNITVTDYKTGGAPSSWSGKTEYEKIKLHKYKQQLIFYKLLVENASSFRGYTVEKGILQFVEPIQKDKIVSLETGFDSDDLDRLSGLIKAVWQHIINLNLPDTSHYDPTLKGILAFEQDLIDGKV